MGKKGKDAEKAEKVAKKKADIQAKLLKKVRLSLPLIRVVRAAFRLAWARTVTDRGERRHGAHKYGGRCHRWFPPAPQ